MQYNKKISSYVICWLLLHKILRKQSDRENQKKKKKKRQKDKSKAFEYLSSVRQRNRETTRQTKLKQNNKIFYLRFNFFLLTTPF